MTSGEFREFLKTCPVAHFPRLDNPPAGRPKTSLESGIETPSQAVLEVQRLILSSLTHPNH
jgi:hypothetical protein